MNIEDIIKQITNLNRSKLSQEVISHKIEKIVNVFNDNYQIVPKEQWGVTITCDGNINATTIQGPFNTEIEAKLFASIWNRKRDEFIEKTLEENPDNENLEFPYLKANAYKLEISDKNDLILKEMIQIIEDGIDKIQSEGIK